MIRPSAENTPRRELSRVAGPMMALTVTALLSLVGCTGQTGDSAPSINPGGKTTVDGNAAKAEEARRKLKESMRAVDEGSKIQTDLALRALSPDQFPVLVAKNGEPRGYATILESLGSGCAAIDLDCDGWDDVIVAGGGDFEERKCVPEQLRVVRNRGGRFTEVTSSVVGTAQQARYYNHGLASTDIDHDGFTDFVLTGYGGVQLFRNLGDGTFISEEVAGLDSQHWSASAAWGDFNGDTFPDLFLVNYVDWSFENDPPCFAADGKTRDNCSPKLFQALPDELFLSNGDGTFADATAKMRVRSDGKGLGIVVADVDLDGHLDAYIGNDVMLNFLYRNAGDGTFEDRSRSSGACVSHRGTPDASMGTDVADFDGDLLPDLWAANFELENFALYRNQGSMLFRHSSDMTGVSAIGSKYVGWGSTMTDFDLDGDLDIAVCNGHVVRYPEHAPVKQAMLLLENREGRYFQNVASVAGQATSEPRNGRGLAVSDWNRDGRPDLVCSPVNEPSVLALNESSTRGHWLHVDLVGTLSPRHAVGAILTLRLSDGSSLLRLQKSGGSYASSSTSTIMFGIPGDAEPDQLMVRWPSGRTSTIRNPRVDSRMLLMESEASKTEPQLFTVPQ